MKILWITNIIFPAPSIELGITPPVMGGWMYSSAKALLDQEKDIKLAVASVYKGDELKSFDIDGIQYYLLPLKGDNTKYNKSLELYWRKICEDFKPDIAHLHGTEFAHGLAFLNACPQIKSVASIQGLVSVSERYYYAGLSHMDIINNITFRDIVKKDTIFHQRKKFYKRGLIEKEIISKLDHIIGRTTWDKSHALAVNNKINYHFCNETLRPSFYGPKWEYDRCDKYSIFLSQAGYPIKGLHQVLKALPPVIRKYPETHLYIAGPDITSYKSLKDKFRISGYGNYIRKLIKKLNLVKHVTFLGFLDESQMVDRYLKSNLFICPSSIENSPNSLGEAQILGVPYLASYVGGAPDMIDKLTQHNLYRFEEIEMLSQLVNDAFIRTSKREPSLDYIFNRHNIVKNASDLFNIYLIMQ